MLRLAAIVAVAAALAAMPAAALAVQNPFLPQPQTQAPPEQQAPAPAPVQEDQPGDLSGATVVVAAIGLAALFGVIWVMIIRDARRATAGRSRVRTSRTDPDAGGRSGTRAPPRGRRLSPAERRRRKRGRAR